MIYQTKKRGQRYKYREKAMATIIKNKEIRRYKSSILKFEEVEKLGLIKEQKKSGEYDAISNALIDGQKGFIVTCAGWTFDDADEWHHIFAYLKDAEYCYNSYVNFKMSDIKEQTLFVVIKEGKKRYVPAEIHNGYIVRVMYEGDLIVPFWNSAVLERFGLLQEVKDLGEVDIREIFNTKFEPALIKKGENEGGVVVLTEEESRRIESHADERIVFLERHNCWETGLNYYQILGNYPKDVFATMKPLLQYHNEEFEEEGDWKGWYTHDTDGLNDALKKIGYKTNF